MDNTLNNNNQEYTDNPDTNDSATEKVFDNELVACQEEVATIKQRFMYLNAEFDNYKKRIERERTQWLSAAQNAVFVDLLPIIDNFDRALQEQEKPGMPAEIVTHMAGFELIAKEFHKFLKKYDVIEIEHDLEFNPLYHEALMHVSSETHQSGQVVSILQKGYKHKGQVLRPAKVSVSE